MWIISFVIGCGVGAGAFYLVKKDDLNRLGTLETELGQLRRDLQTSEANHEQRLREAIATLQQEYQSKIATLEAQLAAANNPAPAATASPKHTVPDTLEPPILAATIQPRTDSTPVLVSSPSGKPCIPPILAQGVTFQTVEAAIASFEPPILAAEIRCRPETAGPNLATPSGKPCIPPILAQA
ncbi:hypothetical protein AWQ21_10870 [Picosynechococcus sp. PCC 7003]|uniref:hypothetical protein n=1 Tax=Picosynechococcus sp. PCC 7003 TaxID=374981 RepID=UPI000810AA4B|nr:hypothetical protein [Picosynechococcus sp. PCC 7003]ANV84835.1 hypothetical protein AWQ21_10870 [Picosynechococcus sp. PCC 7003]